MADQQRRHQVPEADHGGDAAQARRPRRSHDASGSQVSSHRCARRLARGERAVRRGLQVFEDVHSEAGVSRHHGRLRMDEETAVRLGRTVVNKRAWFVVAVAVAVAGPALMWAQGSQYPITLIPPGKGPFTFPEGYQTPWDKIEIMVTAKMSSNLFVLHGSEGLDPAHPDASGGRAMALFGPDGVLMVDTENRQVAEKTLKAIRSFSNAPIKVLVNTHIHPDHTGAHAFFPRQGALIFSQENLRNEMLNPARRANGEPGQAPDMAGIPVVVYGYNPAAPGQPAVTI